MTRRATSSCSPHVCRRPRVDVCDARVSRERIYPALCIARRADALPNDGRESCATHCRITLYHLEHGRVDDGRMALFHKVAWHLSAVLDGFLGEEVRREGLLDSRAACVFLVAEDAPDGLGVPFLLARDRQDVPCGQFLCDPAGCHTFKEKLEDEPHDLGLLLIDGKIAVLALIVAEEV